MTVEKCDTRIFHIFKVKSNSPKCYTFGHNNYTLHIISVRYASSKLFQYVDANFLTGKAFSKRYSKYAITKWPPLQSRTSPSRKSRGSTTSVTSNVTSGTGGCTVTLVEPWTETSTRRYTAARSSITSTSRNPSGWWTSAARGRYPVSS